MEAGESLLFLYCVLMMNFFHRLSAALMVALALLTAGCGDLSIGPGSGDYQFNKWFYYYYSEQCRYDAVGTYDCGRLDSVRPTYKVSLKIDGDGFATLNLDGDYYYYSSREYDSGYDSDFGGYYRFYEDGEQLDVYKDGYALAFWGDDGYVTFYYYDMPY